MHQIKFSLITIGLVLAVTSVSVVRSACYRERHCFEKSTNETHKPGDIWRTEDCFECSCSGYKIRVRACWEFVKDGKDRHEVEVSTEEAKNFSCPLHPFFHLFHDHKPESRGTLPPVRRVHYVIKRSYMECCSLSAYPYNVSPDCKTIFKKNECKYEVVDRKNPTEPCPYPHGFIGK
ncbi:beta-microseminoprotein E1-like [Clavelina lepadiformis]|uniref:beta-microseminoprotein E1-like n=1 Tax=Clavelina lepadiformis TaxID=159417 RepID=UPI0040428F0D